MNRQQFLANFVASIDGIDAAATSLETPLMGIPQWDSLALLTTLAMADAQYGVQISGLELQSCQTVGDIADMVASKMG